jgi:hypothetical protein
MLAFSSVYPIESGDDRFFALFNSETGYFCSSGTKWVFVVFRGGVRCDYQCVSDDEDVARFLNKCSPMRTTSVTVDLVRRNNARVTGMRLGVCNGPGVVVRL